MSINWVMLHEAGGFVPLPNERVIYTSPPRTSLAIQTPNKYPGNIPLSIHSAAGVAHLTNQRIVYLPAKSTPQLQSFSAPLLNLHDSHVSAPFFGPNVWTAVLQPVPGGGIPPTQSAIELTLTFKEGGAFDFSTYFDRIRDRLRQAIDTARESGTMVGEGSETGTGRGGGALSGVNLSAVHLDELPAYSAPAQNAGTPVPPPQTQEGAESIPQSRDSGISLQEENRMSKELRRRNSENDESFSPPTEPPPGYEEAQQQSVANELESRLMRE